MADTLTDGYLPDIEQDPWDDLYKPLSQNIIDFWAKQYKTYYQYYFGENDLPEDPDTPVTIDNFIMSGCAFLSIPNNNAYFGGDNGGYGLLSTYFSFYPPYDNNPVLKQEIIAYTDNSINYGSMSDWAEARPLTVNMPYTQYTKNPSYPSVIYSPQASAIWTSITSQWARYPQTYDSGSFNFFSAPVRVTFDQNNQYSVDNQNAPVLAPRGGAPYSVCWGFIDMDKSSLYTNMPVVSFSPSYMNYYQYQTENGDTITTYFTDNSIINDSSSIPLSFNDYRDYMDDMILQIGENYPDFDTSIHVPTWEELDYIDAGNFYITPIEQLDPLPSAPAFTATFNVGDAPELVGRSLQFYSDSLDTVLGVGTSALMIGAFFFTLLWSKLSR